MPRWPQAIHVLPHLGGSGVSTAVTHRCIAHKAFSVQGADSGFGVSEDFFYLHTTTTAQFKSDQVTS